MSEYRKVVCSCGEEFDKKFCPNCGAKHPDLEERKEASVSDVSLNKNPNLNFLNPFGDLIKSSLEAEEPEEAVCLDGYDTLVCCTASGEGIFVCSEVSLLKKDEDYAIYTFSKAKDLKEKRKLYKSSREFYEGLLDKIEELKLDSFEGQNGFGIAVSGQRQSLKYVNKEGIEIEITTNNLPMDKLYSISEISSLMYEETEE